MSIGTTDFVAGLLLHIGGLDQANMATRVRVVESISPVLKDQGLWQAHDEMLGASWLVAFNASEIEQLIARRHNGEQWKPYKPSASAVICESIDDDVVDVEACVASFHDSRHGVAPPALLRIGNNYVYRNVSSHTVPIHIDLAERILRANDIKE